MMKNENNQQILLEFSQYLKEEEGYAESTITKYLTTLKIWDEIFPNSGFSEFNGDRAVSLVKTIRNTKKLDGKRILVLTVFQKLKHLVLFFKWLSKKPRYKTKIVAGDIRLLRLTQNEINTAKTYKPEKIIPTIDEIIDLINTIGNNTEVDMRDRALISTLGMFAIRNKAIATLPLGSLDMRRGVIVQSPTKGTKTKRRKHIISIPLIFDQVLWDNFIFWIKYLKEQKGFLETDPMFPATKNEHAPGTITFLGENVDRKFWKSSSVIETILKGRCGEAHLNYFNPHSFRHFIVNETMGLKLTGLQFKGLSMSLGHTYINTTYDAYGSQDEDTIIEAVKSIDIQKIRSNDKNKPKNNEITLSDKNIKSIIDEVSNRLKKELEKNNKGKEKT